MNNFTSIGKKIVAIGRNFSDHAKELGSTVPTSPLFFLKPTSSYLLQGGSVELPKGYALGIDLTARDLQNEAIKKGLPWSAAKGFDTFTPIG
ncbi:151_t:CDS:2 [Cetraspora pellucida]|uniref:151_t:CDS:1 n=1 Tax=Cetraspora pellucida TaxID=1433469 RepID=A0A9N9CJS6_9GLOM|nr:151_t:CDS:2 [Cetraspora pellucida]